ncbi:MAG TPA: phage tail protein [Longimicrobium sp.]|nr:phage tail protein [Longimicrobium sp.]
MIAPAAPERLPAVPTPPHDPTSWRLDARAGWRAATLEHLEQAPGGACLTLARLPSVLRAFDEPSGSLGGLAAPANVAVAGDGSLYLLDTAGLRLLRWDPCACAFEPVPCFGGRGGGARELIAPRAIEIHGRDLYLCDAGTAQAGGRVSVWALPEMALRAAWTLPADPPRRANPWRPVAIAVDERGRFWVADPANAMVHRLDRLGRLRQSIGGMGGVRHLAVDCAGRVYVVLDDEDGARVLDADGTVLPAADDPEALRGRFPRLPFPVDALGRMELGALCQPRARGERWFDAAGEAVPPPPPPSAVYEGAGTYLGEALDSRIHRCQWHRVVIRGSVPEGATLRVATTTAEAVPPPGTLEALPESSWATGFSVRPGADGEWDALVRSGTGRYLWLKLEFAGDGNATPRVESVTVEYPRVTLRRHLPAVWSEEPLSADFTDRFLAVFDAGFRALERRLDGQAALYDPLSAPAGGRADFLSWIGEWIGVTLSRQWPEALRRQYLKKAAALFHVRGTREGLRRLVLFFLGMEGPENPSTEPRTRCEPRPGPCGRPVAQPCAWAPPPLILEHFQLRRWLFLGCGRLGDDAVLWGQKIVNRSQLTAGGAAERGARVGATQLITTPDPLRDPFHVYAHRFSVFVPAARVRGADQRRALERLIAGETPAHAQGSVEYVEPRFRIGVQSSIGLDAVVGRYPRGVELDATRLGPASVLEGGPAAGGPRIGASARLEQR